MTNLRRFLRRYGWSYAFVLPSLLTFVIFTLAPVVWALLISFQKYSITRGGQWVVPLYQNFVVGFTQLNGVFMQAIGNTLIYTLVTVTANITIGLILASLIQPLSNWLRTFFRAAYYLPAVTSALIIGMTWAYIFNAQWGFANYLLRLFGLPPVRWLSNPDIALASVTLSAVLTVPATAVVLFSAAMGSIPREYYEAAELDGANAIQQWRHITVPLIKSTTLYLVVIYTIASFEVFERVYVMVPSGVANSTQTIVTQIYNNGFKDLNFGVASAQALVLFVMIAMVAAVQFRLLRSDVEY
ncbi:MAG: carbohydrate ABC transporter permease [Candidatus Roseilinea sp.]|uniref:carbohydrate ABC transporter permease n=1 Tax=Candidatus Roseilinea sp. TaxID=2838777 RepID=UPI00404AA0CF